MRLRTTFLFLLITARSFAYVSEGVADSLKSLVEYSSKNKTGSDSLTVDRLNKIAAEYVDVNPDSTLHYAKKGITLSRKINYRAGIANGLIQTGHINFFRGNFKQAKADFDEAIFIYKILGNRRGLANCYVLYARMYNLQAEYATALAYLNLALPIENKLKQNDPLADCYKNFGIVYYSQGKLALALDYYYKGLIINLKSGNKLAAGANYNNIGAVLQNMEVYPKSLEYFKKALAIFQDTNNQHAIATLNENIGEVLIAQKKYDEAIPHLIRGIRIARGQDDKEGLSAAYTDMGLCYAHKNQMDKALYYLDESLQIAGKYKIVYNQANTLIGFATVYNQKGDYKNAYKYALQGEALSLKLGNLAVRANAALQLNETLAGLGKYDEAYKFLKQYNRLKDSLNNNETIQKLTSYNLEMDYSKKESQLVQVQEVKDIGYQKRLDKEELTTDIFLILTLCMVAITGLYYLQKRKQEKINKMLGERNREVLKQKADLDNQAQKLNDLNTMKDRLMSILAHDLRSPLGTLRGLFSLLQDDSISNEQMMEMIPGVLKKLDYTSDFLDTLLFWINSQMENFETEAKSFLVKDIVANLTENYHELAAEKGINLIDKVPYNVVASADPNSIRIVIRNLVTNAIKFSNEHDVIEISAAPYDEHSNVITVKDSGVGISKEHLDKLFKAKVNSKEGTNKESGTGMGLMFCKDLVEKSGGKIWVTSKQGEGTEFSFTLPSDINDIDLEWASV